MVPGKGFEPSRRMTLDPKTSASASSAIRARVQTIETPVCDGFWCPGRDSNSQHLAAVASGTTASAKIAPPGHKQQTIENPPVRGFGVPGGNRTRNTSRHQHLKLACLPNFTTGTYWRCRCDSNACAGFHRPGSLANCSLHRLGTAPYDGVP